MVGKRRLDVSPCCLSELPLCSSGMPFNFADELARVQVRGTVRTRRNSVGSAASLGCLSERSGARNSGRKVGQRFAALERVDQAAALLPELGRNAERDLELRSAILTSTALPDMKSHVVGPWPATGYAVRDVGRGDRYVVAVEDGTIAVFACPAATRCGVDQV